MRKNTLNKAAILFCALAIISCKAKKALIATTPPPVIANAAPIEAKAHIVNLMDSVAAKQLSFTTFSGKANAKLDINGSKNDAVLNIHINHDKMIWLSVTVNLLVTVEVARAVITPDSIKMINKIDGVYLKKPFSYVYQYANDQVNYKMLESILVGNTLNEIVKDSHAGIQTDKGNTTLAGTIEDIVYQLMLGSDWKARQLNLSNHNAGQALQVNYDEFTPTAFKLMPAQIAIQSTAPNKKIQVNLHYTKIDFDQPLQYTFNIPQGYKPVDGN